MTHCHTPLSRDSLSHSSVTWLTFTLLCHAQASRTWTDMSEPTRFEKIIIFGVSWAVREYLSVTNCHPWDRNYWVSSIYLSRIYLFRFGVTWAWQRSVTNCKPWDKITEIISKIISHSYSDEIISHSHSYPTSFVTRAQRAPAYADVCCRMLTYADVCWHMLTYAAVCWHMLTYADTRAARARAAKTCHVTSGDRDTVTWCYWGKGETDQLFSHGNAQ